MPAEPLEVPIPFHWEPRAHQRRLWRALQRGTKRTLEVAHRRWGKDDVALHWAATQCVQKPAVYWHMLPEASQARKAIWTAVNPHSGIRRIEEAFPPEIRDGPPRETDMLIRFKSGAIWQVVGSDNYNSLVGSPPFGVVMSEWALANPAAWDFLEPVLVENGGWAMFISTPRGRNHMARMFDAYQGDPEWYVERSSARDTDVFSPEQLDKIRRDYVVRRGEAVGKAFFNQEYLCSFDAPVVGAYYAEWIQSAEDEGRITIVPYDAAYPVVAAWDLGYGDQTCIWVAQQCGRELRLIDYYANSGQAAGHYVEWLREQRYPMPKHILPHDANAHEKASGQTYAQAMEKLGCDVTVLPPSAIEAGIQAVRALLPRCVFDRGRCQKGVDSLRQYRADYDEKHEVLRPAPVHDWASHGADAFRYLAMGLDMTTGRRFQRQRPRERVGLV